MYRILIMMTLLLGVAAVTSSQTQRTTRKGLRPATTDAVTNGRATVSCDTVFSSATDSLRISGFDKPLRSSRESMFITNNSHSTVTKIRLAIRYSDSRGRELHSRECTVDCMIPAGATRQVTIKTWDLQQSFYYRRSARPRRADATPFDVTCDILYYLTESHQK